VTGLTGAGVDALRALLRTGHLARPDLLLILVSAGGHFLMILGCLVCFLRRNPKRRQWAELFGGAVLAIAALVLISPLRHHDLPLPLDVAPRAISGRQTMRRTHVRIRQGCPILRRIDPSYIVVHQPIGGRTRNVQDPT